MPWDEWTYPVSMRRLAPVVRAKAVEIANALLGEGMDEGRAIRIAIARAKVWALRRGLPQRIDDCAGSTDLPPPRATWPGRSRVMRGRLSWSRSWPKR